MSNIAIALRAHRRKDPKTKDPLGRVLNDNRIDELRREEGITGEADSIQNGLIDDGY